MRWLGFVLLLLAADRLSAAPDIGGNEVTYSQSGQFVVSGRHVEPSAARRFRFDGNVQQFVATGWTAGTKAGDGTITATGAATLLLDPNYLVASAERLRSGFNDLLDLKETHRGRIYISLFEAASPDDEITFIQVYDKPKQTWSARISMPTELAADRVLRVLIQALLFEASHRGAGPGGCEIPLWLTEGLVAHLGERLGDLAVFEPARTINAAYSPLSEAGRLKARLGNETCFTLDQLSWPRLLEDRSGTRRAFELSSHALVLELAQLRQGGRCLGLMIRNLPQYANWQFAFLAGFQPHFPSLLDAEKWWAIQSLLVGGRDAFAKWTIAESLKRLDEALVLPVERRVGSEEELTREEMTLREIVVALGFEQQQPMLMRTVAGLFALELRASPHAVRLIADYRALIERYLADREDARQKDSERSRPSRREEVVVETTLRRLDMLARLRQDFEVLLPAEGAPAGDPPALSSAASP